MEQSKDFHCDICGHHFNPYENFVIAYEPKSYLCESCFFDNALKQLNAFPYQMNHEATGYKLKLGWRNR